MKSKSVVITLDKISVNVLYEDERIIDNMKEAFAGYMTFRSGFNVLAYTIECGPQTGIDYDRMNYSYHGGREPHDKENNHVYIGKNHLICEYAEGNNYLEFTKYIVLNSMMRIFENSGYYFLHSSCVAKNGKAVAFTGCKGAGKTATMINMIANGYQLVTNDKSAVRLDENGRPIVIGFPTTVGIRMTNAWSSELRNRPLVARIKSKHPEIFVANDSTRLDDESKKFFFEPKVITHSYNSNVSEDVNFGIRPVMPLEKIINTKFDPTRTDFFVARENISSVIWNQRENAVSIEKPYLEEIDFAPFKMDTMEIFEHMISLDNLIVEQGPNMEKQLIEVINFESPSSDGGIDDGM